MLLYRVVVCERITPDNYYIVIIRERITPYIPLCLACYSELLYFWLTPFTISCDGLLQSCPTCAWFQALKAPPAI